MARRWRSEQDDCRVKELIVSTWRANRPLNNFVDKLRAMNLARLDWIRLQEFPRVAWALDVASAGWDANTAWEYMRGCGFVGVDRS